MNIGVQICLRPCFLFFWVYVYPGVSLLQCMVVLCLMFWEPSRLLPCWLHRFALPVKVHDGANCPTSSPALGGVAIPDVGHSGRCVVRAHCCFILFLFYFLAVPCDLWDISSLTRDWTRIPSSESEDSQPRTYQGIPLFQFAFSWWQLMGSICSICHPCLFFGEVSVKVFGPFFIQVVFVFLLLSLWVFVDFG